MNNKTGMAARPRGTRRRFLLSRFYRNSDGATAVEFGLLAIPFLMALFAILETGVQVAAQQLLVNATDDVARQIRTGQITSTNQAQLRTMICERIELLVTSGCPGLRVDLRTYPSFQAVANQNIDVVGNNIVLEYGSGGVPKALKAEVGAGGAKQSMRTFYFWPVMVGLLNESFGTAGNGTTLLSATQTWQNEAF
ncbi:MAG: pilus assembly protein [Rhizobiaceae bacterium]|nr:pilus assembly protein [Rhizobiaceae bacterium]